MAGNRRDHVPFLGCHVEVDACAREPRCGSCPLARSLRGPAPQRRTFPTRDSHLRQGHAFANRLSRDRSLLKKGEKRLRGHPGDQQEGAGRDRQHQERAEIVIIRRTAQLKPVFHRLGPASSPIYRYDSRPRIGVSIALAARTGSKYSRRNAILSPAALRNST